MKQNSTIPKSSEERKVTYSATENIKGNLELNIPIPMIGSKVHLEFACHPGQILFEVLYQPSVSNTLALEDIYPNAQKISSMSSDFDDKEKDSSSSSSSSSSNKETDNNDNDNDNDNGTTTAAPAPEKRKMSYTLSNSRRSITRRTGSKAIVGPIKIGNYIGSWTSEEDGGTLYIRFDNSGSWLAGKVLTYFIEVEEPDLEVLHQLELKEMERQRIFEEEEAKRNLREEQFQNFIMDLRSELEKSKEEHKQLQKQYVLLLDNHNNIKLLNANMEKELEAANNSLAAHKTLEKAFFSVQETVGTLEQQLLASENEIANLKNDAKTSDLMIETLKKQIQSMKETSEAASNQLNDELKAKLKLIQELQVKLNAREIEYDKLHVILQSSTNENGDLKNRLNGIKEAEAKVKARDSKIEELHSKIDFLNNRNEELKVKVDVIQSELDSQINMKVNIEKQHTVLEAAFLAANQMINKFEEEKIHLNQELIHTKNVAESKVVELANVENTLLDVKRELSVSKSDLEKAKHDNEYLQLQVEKLQETSNEYKNTLNTLAPKEHENAQLLNLVKQLEEKLVTSNKAKTEAESKNVELELILHGEVTKRAAATELQAKVEALNAELGYTKSQLDITKKDLQGEIDLYGAAIKEKANLEEKVTELQVTNVTLESKIVDYERVRTKLESNISDLISIKNLLEAKLSSPEVVNHDSIVKDYENKLVNVDQGYRSIVSQLEDRVALLDEENNTLKAGKLQSDKEFADLIYSASVNASTAEAKIRDLEIQSANTLRDSENKSKDYIQKLMELHRDEMFQLNGLHKTQLNDQVSHYESKIYEVSIELQVLQQENKNSISTYESKIAQMIKDNGLKVKDLEAVIVTLQSKLSESADHITSFNDMSVEINTLTHQLAAKEQELNNLKVEKDEIESQMKIYKMYKNKVTDLAEKIDSDDIIPKDLESCHREIVSLRASRQLLQSIKKSLEDQNLSLKSRLEELDPTAANNITKDINIITDAQAVTGAPKKVTVEPPKGSFFDFLFPASPPRRPAPIPQLVTPEKNSSFKDALETAEKEIIIGNDADGPSPVEHKPPSPSQVQPPSPPKSRKEDIAPLSFIGDFFSTL